jgi:hypothetical protein
MSQKPNPRPADRLTTRYDLPQNNKVLPPSQPVKTVKSSPAELAKLISPPAKKQK